MHISSRVNHIFGEQIFLKNLLLAICKLISFFYASISLLIIGYNDCTSLNIPTSTKVINTCKAFREQRQCILSPVRAFLKIIS